MTGDLAGSLTLPRPRHRQRFSCAAGTGVSISVSADADTLEQMAAYCAGYWLPTAWQQDADCHVTVAADDGTLAEALRERRRDAQPVPGTVLDVVRLPLLPPTSAFARFADAQLYDLTVLSQDETIVVAGRGGPPVFLAGVRALRNVAATIWNARGGVYLHAAALDMGGEGILLLGPRRAGKTSQVCGLLARSGAAFISNDRALLFSDGTLVGVPVAVNLRAGTLKRFAALEGLRTAHDAGHNISERTTDDISVAPAAFAGCFGARLVSASRIKHVFALSLSHDREGVSVARMPVGSLAEELCRAQFDAVDASQPFWAYARQGTVSIEPSKDVAGWLADSGIDSLDETTETLASCIQSGRQ